MATVLANKMGSCKATRQTAVPILIRVVTAAASREYYERIHETLVVFGNASPVHKREPTGRWECSPVKMAESPPSAARDVGEGHH